MLTELDIINAMVGSTGIAPFTAQNARHPRYVKALAVLDRCRIELNGRGLYYNTEVRTIQAQADGTVIVPSKCVKADPVDGKIQLTLRGNRMYDTTRATYSINQDVELKMYFDLSIEEMPLEPQAYLLAAAVHKYYVQEVGKEPKMREYKEERATAWRRLYREHIRNQQVNAFRGNSAAARMRHGSRILRGRR